MRKIEKIISKYTQQTNMIYSYATHQQITGYAMLGDQILAFASWIVSRGDAFLQKYKLMENVWFNALVRTIICQPLTDALNINSMIKNDLAKVIVIILGLTFTVFKIYVVINLKESIKPDNNPNIILAAIIIPFFIEFIGNMGSIFSEIKAEKRHEEAEKRHEKRYEEAEKRHEKRHEESKKRHEELMATIANLSGSESTVRQFKEGVFQEHKDIITNELNNFNQNVMNHLSNLKLADVEKLDVMQKYDPIDHLRPRELLQRQLTHE